MLESSGSLASQYVNGSSGALSGLDEEIQARPRQSLQMAFPIVSHTRMTVLSSSAASERFPDWSRHSSQVRAGVIY